MQVREARAEDARPIAELHSASWADAYRSILDPAYLAGPMRDEKLASWQAQLAIPDARAKVRVALDRTTIVGFVCVRLEVDARWGALIDNLHTMPNRRSEGVGAGLLRSAAAWVEEMDPRSGLHLYVFEQNVRAMRFYERHGALPGGSLPSRIPSAHGAPVTRLAWPRAGDVV